jgi:DNA-binding NtrC family response regulator
MHNEKQKQSILVVDDSVDTLELIQRNLCERGFTVYTASSVEDGIELLETVPIDLVITDMKMPKVSGMDLIRHMRDNYKDKEVVLITGYPSLDGAVQAIKTGAAEYITKPFTDKELFDAVDRALEKSHRMQLEHGSENHLNGHYEGLIGESEGMKQVYAMIDKASQTTATVLITGESGTGKELVARAIHYRSDRASSPFIAVNCSAIPEQLLESELFGYTKGAFTGANQARAGFFQTADGGTMLLDEISEMSLSMQAKLLRVLQDKEITMLGSRRPQHVDVRIIAATNKNLQDAVAKGSFREDLFYRLHVISIELPPLRDRGEDIYLLINYFKKKFALEMGKPVPRFSDDVLLTLRQCAWPGNIRELENLVHRLIIMSDSETIETADLPEWMRFSVAKKTGLLRSLKEVEKDHILGVLEMVKGNKTRAAEILGIDRKTLRTKIQAIEEEKQTE